VDLDKADFLGVELGAGGDEEKKDDDDDDVDGIGTGVMLRGGGAKTDVDSTLCQVSSEDAQPFALHHIDLRI
jgi:hypothetical protein